MKSETLFYAQNIKRDMGSRAMFYEDVTDGMTSVKSVVAKI